jgi:SWI/SNF-related matrix-associated actin-dependent regulator of chromatin subfamily A member 5
LPDPFVNGEHIVAASSKLIIIDKLLADILPKGEQILIFSVRVLSISLVNNEFDGIGIL